MNFAPDIRCPMSYERRADRPGIATVQRLGGLQSLGDEGQEARPAFRDMRTTGPPNSTAWPGVGWIRSGRIAVYTNASRRATTRLLTSSSGRNGMYRWILTIGLVAASVSTVAQSQEAKFSFPEERIPQFNIPHADRPPVIDGHIDPEEWRQAVCVTGVVWTSSLDYRDRPVSFWVMWDAEHLYLAVRSDILPGHRLYRSKRETYSSGVVHDDSYEFGLFLHDRNKLAGQSSSFLKFVVNSVGCGEYMKIYPSIGQNLFNWRPTPKIANRVYERGGRRWWDMEMAMDLRDLQLPAANKPGDLVKILLSAPLKNPEWQWLDVPSATGHLQYDGFPRVVSDCRPSLRASRRDLGIARRENQSPLCDP